MGLAKAIPKFLIANLSEARLENIQKRKEKAPNEDFQLSCVLSPEPFYTLVLSNPILCTDAPQVFDQACHMPAFVSICLSYESSNKPVMSERPF